MSDTVIKVENLSKKYILGHQKQEKYIALRDVISNSVKSILKPNSKNKDAREEFWALKDVSFEIKQGDRVGIIGRNGAGKSTLLKILSRITEPTQGQIKIKGRVASLLEVGTGFHPELTGRENIFLNGAILGMGKVEIKKKFDEIVAFAEVEKFLDTPVKRYSSGMYVRLAFAVAAHLEPEILVVDEVLAVGDATFQKKCLDKMQEVAKEGRTILFVSHNMAAIRNLCKNGIFLERGTIKQIGNINQVADDYQNISQLNLIKNQEYKLKYFFVEKVKIYSPNSPVIKPFAKTEIVVIFAGKEKILIPDVYVSIKGKDGQRIIGIQLQDLDVVFSDKTKDRIKIGFQIESLPLMPGTYDMEVELKDLGRNYWEFIPNVFSFEVIETPVYGNKKSGWWNGNVALKVKAATYAHIG